MVYQVEVTVCSGEICERTSISEQDLAEIVNHGIVRPQDMHADEWRFAEVVVVEVARAARLRHDLEMDWPGVALALQLLAEVEQLRAENATLRRRLERFDG
ncbi:MAG: chaperone modulator CbpM [Alcanivoracaceae bacterium]